MPIPVVCASCRTKLNAPDAAAGRKVKCPKCQAVLAVPAAAAPPAPPPAAGGTPFDFGGEPAPPPQPPRPAGQSRSAPLPPPPPPEPEPLPPPVAAGGGESFDFGGAVASADPPRGRGDRPRRPRDEDAPPPDRADRPRRPRADDEAAPAADADRPRGRRPAKKGPPLALLLAGGGFLLLTCCGGGGYGVYYVYDRVTTTVKDGVSQATKKLDDDSRKAGGGDAGGGGGGAVPTGWKAYAAKDGSFKGYFPVAPKEETQPQKGPKGAAPTVKQYMADTDDVMAGLVVIKFPAGTPAAAKTAGLDQMASVFTMMADGKADPKDVTWLGQKGKETVLKEPGGTGEMTIRQTLVGNTAYVGIVGFKAGRRQDVVDGFFNNVEPLSK